MLLKRLLTQSDCDFWKFGHYDIPIRFSNEKAKAPGRGFVQETGMLAEQAAMLAYRFACGRMVCLWCILVPQNIKLLAVDFKPDVKLPFSDKNDFLNFLQLVENYNLIFNFPWLQIPQYHEHKLLKFRSRRIKIRIFMFHFQIPHSKVSQENLEEPEEQK